MRWCVVEGGKGGGEREKDEMLRALGHIWSHFSKPIFWIGRTERLSMR